MSFQHHTAVKNQHKGLSNHSSPIWNCTLCTGSEQRIGRGWGGSSSRTPLPPQLHVEAIPWCSYPNCSNQKTTPWHPIIRCTPLAADTVIVLLCVARDIIRSRRVFRVTLCVFCGWGRPAVLLLPSICRTLTWPSCCCKPHVAIPTLCCLTPLCLAAGAVDEPLRKVGERCTAS